MACIVIRIVSSLKEMLSLFKGFTLKKHEYTDKSTCTALVYAVTCNFHFYLHTNFCVHEQHVWFMNRVKGLIKGMAIPSPNFACP